MTRLYRYVIVTDGGDAPCIDNATVTLATCKPVIRRTARVGDWVAAFSASPAPTGLLVWAGRIATTEDWLGYAARYPSRRDACYRPIVSGGFERLRPGYHDNPAQVAKDLGAGILIFDPAATWYFGNRPVALPAYLMPLAARGIGHRVTGDEHDIERLVRWLTVTYAPGLHGSPTHSRAC